MTSSTNDTKQPANSAAIYSFRAECPGDVTRLLKVCKLKNIDIKVVYKKQDQNWPDVEIEISSTADVETVRGAMFEVQDGHVMVETLRPCPLAENSLIRDRSVYNQ